MKRQTSVRASNLGPVTGNPVHQAPSHFPGQKLCCKECTYGDHHNSSGTVWQSFAFSKVNQSSINREHICTICVWKDVLSVRFVNEVFYVRSVARLRNTHAHIKGEERHKLGKINNSHHGQWCYKVLDLVFPNCETFVEA